MDSYAILRFMRVTSFKAIDKLLQPRHKSIVSLDNRNYILIRRVNESDMEIPLKNEFAFLIRRH